MKKTVIIIVILAVCFTGNAQQVWYFGLKGGIQFNGTGLPTAFGSATTNPIYTNEGCAMIHDVAGNILISTDGSYVYDKNNSVMPNANGDLKGGGSATQSAIVVPIPGCDCKKYFVFTVASLSGGNDQNHPESAGLSYSVVDLGLNNGNGDVVPTTKNTQLVGMNQTGLFKGYSSEKITAAKDGAGGFWIVAHGVNRSGNNFNAKRFYAFHITAGSIGNCSNPTVSVSPGNCIVTDIGPEMIDGAAVGQMKLSKGASKLAYATWNYKTAELFDFNNSTGVVSNHRQITGFDGNTYGIEFSPSEKYFYITETSGSPTPDLYQMDATLSSGTTIWSQKTSISNLPQNNSYVYGSLQLWTDGKIYAANYNDGKIGVIKSPDLAGTAANYQHNAITLPANTVSRLSLPTVIQGFNSCGSENENTCCPGTNLICNGDFESTKKCFESQYNAYSQQRSFKPGEYIIMNYQEANRLCKQWDYFNQAPCQKTGKGMFVNGATNGSGSKVIWKQQINYNGWAQYRFCMDLIPLMQCCFNVAPKLEVKLTYQSGGVTKTVLLNQTTTENCGIKYSQPVAQWEGSDGGTATLSITLDETGIGDGNDFVLDNIALIELQPIPKVITNSASVTTSGNLSINGIFSGTLPAGASCGWFITPLDANGQPDPNCPAAPLSWWSANTNFVHFNGCGLSGNAPGKLLPGKSYKITFATAGTCYAWDAVAFTVKVDPASMKMVITKEQKADGISTPILKTLRKETQDSNRIKEQN